MSEKTIHREIGKIKQTQLGFEDHGIFTALLMMDYGGSGQGVGGYGLGEYNKELKCQEGTAFGAEWIIRVLQACGVDSWEKLKGRTVYVLKDSDGWNSRSIGIAPLPTEEGTEFLFADLQKKYYPEKADS